MPNAILESVKDFNTITIFRHVFADMDAIGISIWIEVLFRKCLSR